MRPVPDLRWFDTMLKKLCVQFPLPVRVSTPTGDVYRFEDKTIHAAILLKTARYISGLHAGQLLLCKGFLQELGTVKRTLDDFSEDAIFLAMGCIQDSMIELHTKYLSAFWEEDPDHIAFRQTPKKKNEVLRKDIQNYLARVANGGEHDHIASSSSKYLSRIYSGFVHGSASALMDMFNPQTNLLEVTGIKSPFLMEDYSHSFENYFFRGVCLLGISAKAIGVTEVVDEATAVRQQLEPHYHQ